MTSQEWAIQQFSALNGIGFSRFEPGEPKRGIIPRGVKPGRLPKSNVVEEVAEEGSFGSEMMPSLQSGLTEITTLDDGLNFDDIFHMPSDTSFGHEPTIVEQGDCLWSDQQTQHIWMEQQYDGWHNEFVKPPSPPPSPPPPPPPPAFVDSEPITSIEGLSLKLKLPPKPVIPTAESINQSNGIHVSDILNNLQLAQNKQPLQPQKPSKEAEDFEFPEYFWSENLEEEQPDTRPANGTGGNGEEADYLSVLAQSPKTVKSQPQVQIVRAVAPVESGVQRIKQKNTTSTTRDPAPLLYTQFLWDQCQTPSGKANIKSLEKQFLNLLSNKKESGVMLPAMNGQRRRIVHELGLFYHFTVKSYDKEPNRSCFVKKNKASRIPSVLLSVSTVEPEKAAIHSLSLKDSPPNTVFTISDVPVYVPLSVFNVILGPIIGSYVLLKRQSKPGGLSGRIRDIDAVFSTSAKKLVGERLIKKKTEYEIVKYTSTSPEYADSAHDSDRESCYSEPESDSILPPQCALQKGWSQLPSKPGQPSPAPIVQKHEKYADMGWVRNTFSGLKQTQ
eukprot:TRINITY_DN3751_c0_g1_i1.p1 TRINITY_DN3751_c0_g1~~TRINITY_DN3751_c0_g1_i1.p1  ORF type:complete len:558 (+),score=84.64 TRINITY_DN3751_c0_g1_i1:38-1711(+)